MCESWLSGNQETRRRIQRAGSSTVAALLVAFSVSCSSSTSPGSIASVAVAGTPPAVGGTSQFTATATLADGTTQDVTTLATWSSSNSSDATVSPTGVVAGVAAGAATIQATYQNVTGADAITVTAP